MKLTQTCSPPGMDPNGLGLRIVYQGRKEPFLDQARMVILPDPSQDIKRSVIVQMSYVSKDQQHKTLELRSTLADLLPAFSLSRAVSSLPLSLISHNPQQGRHQRHRWEVAFVRAHQSRGGEKPHFRAAAWEHTWHPLALTLASRNH